MLKYISLFEIWSYIVDLFKTFLRSLCLIVCYLFFYTEMLHCKLQMVIYIFPNSHPIFSSLWILESDNCHQLIRVSSIKNSLR